MVFTVSRFFTVTVAVWAAWLLAGCVHHYEEPLKVGTNTWIGYEPLYLARDLGYYQGKNIRLVELASTTQALDALRTGKLDMAGLTLDEAMMLAQEGVPLRVLWVLNISAGADALMVPPSITHLQQLRGKRIGVEQTAVGAYMLHAALSSAGLTPQDIHIIPLPLDEHVVAWENQQVDALITFDPVRQKLHAQGAVDIFNSNHIRGEIVDVLVAHEKALQCCASRIQALIAGQQRALHYMQTQQADALQRMAPRQGLPPGQVAQALAGIELPDTATNRQIFQQELAHTAQQLQQVMQERKLLHQAQPLPHLIEPRFAASMQEVQP